MGMLSLTRDQILGHRRRASTLDRRLPYSKASLEQAAWAGLQDSAPRAALLSLHARVEGIAPDSWEAPGLMQVWGPRFAVYVIAERDRALFTWARYPDDVGKRQVADKAAALLAKNLGDRRLPFGQAAMGVKGSPVLLRYATLTGTIAIRWDGARQPDVWLVPRPKASPAEARRAVAERYLHVFGPSSAVEFANWLGIKPPPGRATFDELVSAGDLVRVSSPVGDGFILAADEPSFRAKPDQPAPARLLPSGDTYTLLKGKDRELLVPDAASREQLWTPRVWPGALLVDGEIVGTWRRDQHRLSVSAWRRLTPAQTAAVEQEAKSLPLPKVARLMDVTWQISAQ